MQPIPTNPPGSLSPDRPAQEAQLRRVAVELESSFLAEMLGQAGLGNGREAFGGGIGEESFASFLRQEQARAMAEQGGIGLAEHIFNSLKVRIHG